MMLTIELVPSTCWFSNVRSEVSKADWDKLRRSTYARSGRVCQVCGGVGPDWPVECHEIWDYDDVAHVQKLLGLVALCPACHQVKHIGLANVNGRGEEAERHLAQVNNWTARQASLYVQEQFRVWDHRSQYEWRLDLSWLAGQGVAVQAGPGARVKGYG